MKMQRVKAYKLEGMAVITMQLKTTVHLSATSKLIGNNLLLASCGGEPHSFKKIHNK